MKIRNLVIGLAAGAITAAFTVSASETNTTKSGTITMYPKTTICLAVNHQTDTVTVADCNETRPNYREGFSARKGSSQKNGEKIIDRYCP